jgi:dihydropteroate synthase
MAIISSSRPGAEHITSEEKTQRVVEPSRALANTFPEAILSIDTFRASVALQALEAGAHMVNDISGGHLDEEMIAMVGKMKIPYVAMHMKGTPQTMKGLNHYENDLLLEMRKYFSEVMRRCTESGVHDVIVDPGFGFAKNIEQNYHILKHLSYFKMLEAPILVGLSRKSMIHKVLKKGPEESLNGSTVLHTLALLNGADILRVHDVEEASEVLQLMTHYHDPGI